MTPMIETGHKTTVFTTKNNVFIFRVNSMVSCFSACSYFPIAFADKVSVAAMIYSNGAIILLCTVYAKGEMLIYLNTVKLGRWLIVISGPVFTSIETYLGATIVANYHASRLTRVDPKIMMITMGGIVFTEGFASILRMMITNIHYIKLIDIGRVSINTSIIPSSLAYGTLIIDFLPGFAAVVAPI